MKRLLIFFAVLLAPPLLAQETDSLEQLLQKKLPDTTRLNTLLQLSNHFRFADPVKGRALSLRTVQLAKTLHRDKALGDALHYLASSYFQVAMYDSSVYYNEQAMAIRLRIKDEQGLAGSYTNLGQLYGDRGRSNDAFDLLHKAEKIYQKLGLERNLSLVYNSLGNLYYSQKLYELAYKSHKQSLALRKKIGDDAGQVASLNNIGHAIYYLHGADSARPYYESAVEKAVQTGDVYTEIQSLNNLGAFYIDIEDPQKAIATLRRAIDLGEGTEYEELLGNAYMNYAKLVLQLKKDKSLALQYALKAEKSINMQNLPEQTYQAQNMIASIYSLAGDYRSAYEYMKSAYNVKDTFIRQSVQKQMSELEAKYQAEKKQLEIENLKQLEKLNAVKLEAKSSELNRKTLQLTLVGVLALSLLIVGYFVLKAYAQKRQANLEISRQKDEVELQKELVELRNREILDSITYAKRLQDAILPPLSDFDKYLPESFVLYKPKDIVAGDFYWLHATNQNEVLVAAADCTGHGVPGAMVSVVCSNALNRAVKEFAITEPGNILDKVTQLVEETFEKSGAVVKDGMDISLCRFYKKADGIALQWAGANNPFWICSEGNIREIRATKQSVGRNEQNKKFETHIVDPKPGDMVYLFTDGYADQFGMPAEKWDLVMQDPDRHDLSGKKFKYRQLQELLQKISTLPAAEQKLQLEQAIDNWQRSLEQVDDICIIGIRI